MSEKVDLFYYGSDTECCSECGAELVKPKESNFKYCSKCGVTYSKVKSEVTYV